MNRNFFIAGMAIIICLLCTSCGKKVALTAEDAAKKFETMGFKVADNTSKEDSSAPDLQTVLSAKNDIFNIDFYKFKTNARAVEVYVIAGSYIDKIKDNSSGTFAKSANLPNSAFKELTANGNYYYMSRIDNTLVSCETSAENKDSVKAVMDRIGY